jgi:hypothetical protein
VTAVSGLAGPGDAALLVPGPLAARVEVDGVPVEDLAESTRLTVGAATLVLEAPGAGGAPVHGLAEGPAAPAVPARVLAGGLVRAGDPVAIDAVAVPAGDALDLHAFAPADVAAAVLAYLEEASVAGREEVRVVHGRGRGVQREIVRRLLAGSPRVLAFGDAPPDRGGWGATLVRLRPAPR